MRLLDVAILVRLLGLDLLHLHPVVAQQGRVPLGELLLARGVVHRQAHAIRAVPLGHAAQFPHGVLKPFAEALEALRKTDRDRFPVRVRQHEVIDQVVERLAADRHGQALHVREVRSTQSPRMMHLAEEHFLRRTCRRSPALHATLKASQLRVVELPRVLRLQPRKQRLGLQARSLLQLLMHFRPDLGERVSPGPPSPLRNDFAGKPPKPPILPSRLLVHVRLVRRLSQRLPRRQRPPQPFHLPIRDHRKSPSYGDLR